MLAGIDWPAFLLAMAIVELTPGPNMGWLTALSAQKGQRAGLSAVAGITLGLSLQLLAATTGLTALLATSPMLYGLLRWAGIGFMLYLAWEAWRYEGSASTIKANHFDSFGHGLLANILNPKALVFYMVVVGQFTHPEQGAIWLQTLSLGAIHVLLALLVHVGLVILGSRLGKTALQHQSSVPMRLVFALSLAAIALWLAFTG